MELSICPREHRFTLQMIAPIDRTYRQQGHAHMMDHLCFLDTNDSFYHGFCLSKSSTKWASSAAKPINARSHCDSGFPQAFVASSPCLNKLHVSLGTGLGIERTTASNGGTEQRRPTTSYELRVSWTAQGSKITPIPTKPKPHNATR